jgi:hypothetical protein
MRKLFSLILVVALVIPASFPGLPALSRGAENFEFRSSNFEIVPPGPLAPLHPCSPAPRHLSLHPASTVPECRCAHRPIGRGWSG